MELSRSEQKRRVKQLEELVEELASLPPSLLEQIPAVQEVRELLKEASELGRDGARRRQIKYITKLLREEPVEALYQFLSERKGKALQNKKKLHELEHMRDALIEEALAARHRASEMHEEFGENWQSEVANEIAAALPLVDKSELARLGFFFAASRNPRHSREIFRLLQAALGQAARQETLG